MASPFKKKSPLNAYKYSLTSQYANPKGVIQPIVEAEAAKAIGDASKKVLGVYSKIEADKKAKTASDEAGDLKHQRAMEVKWGKGNTGPAVKPASHEENMSNFGLTSFKDVQAERDAKDFMNRDFGGNKDSNSLVNIGRAGKKPSKPITPYIPPSKAGRMTGKDQGQITTSTRRFGAMEGSPNKLIGDTMDPYGQPQRGIRDFTFNENEIALGTLGNQASMGVQKEIYGGGQAQVAAEQLAAEQLQAPLLSKDHGVKQAHTHPTKTTTKISGKGEMPGSSYVEGDSPDEDASNAVGLSPHTATLVKTTRKGEPYIREKNAPKFPLSKFENFINENIGKAGAPRRSLSNFPRPDYISNEGDQLDPNKFLFQKTPKK